MSKPTIDTESRIATILETSHKAIIDALVQGGCQKDKVHEELYDLVVLMAVLVTSGNGHLDQTSCKYNAVSFCFDLIKAVDTLPPARQRTTTTRLM